MRPQARPILRPNTGCPLGPVHRRADAAWCATCNEVSVNTTGTRILWMLGITPPFNCRNPFLAALFRVRFAKHCPALPRRISLRLRAWMQRMRLGRAHSTRRGPPDRGVGMDVGGPVHPGPAPVCIVQEYGVRSPVEADPSCRPAPWREEPADGHSEAEADRAAVRESGPWRQD